jgi:hypothetical protein
MKSCRKLQLLAAMCVLGASSPFTPAALGGESLNRFGRLIGFGWSDGYHACSEDGFHLGENLPPRSYAADHSLYASQASTVSYGHTRAAAAPCANCGPSGQFSPAHEVPMHSQPSANPDLTAPEIVEPLIVEQPEATRPSESDLLDNPLDREDPTSPSDRMPTPPSSRAQPIPSTSPQPGESAKPTAPPRTPKPAPQPPVPVPMPTESDDDLLLDLPEDSDGLIDELPPPARDPLSPENSTYDLRPRQRRFVPVAQTSAEMPVSRPTRIGTRDPQRLPSTR